MTVKDVWDRVGDFPFLMFLALVIALSFLFGLLIGASI